VSLALTRSYRALPEIIYLPDFLLIGLITIGIIGIGYHQKSYKSLLPTAIIYMTLTMVYLETIFPSIWAFAQKIVENPYAKFNALTAAKAIAYIPLLLALPFFSLAFRSLMVMQRTDPMFEEKMREASLKHALNSLKNRYRDVRKTIYQIRTIWSEKEDNNNRPSVLKRLKSIIQLLTAQDQGPDLDLCLDVETQEKVKVPFQNLFQHFLIVGPTGSGKTSRVIKPVAWQMIKHIIQGRKMGLTIVEPKGDLIADISDWCEKIGIPYTRIDPPIGEQSAKFNPLQGDLYMAAEGTRMVMRKMFGRQDAFFGLVQEMAARNTILLLKRIRGDNLDLNTVRRALRSHDQMKTYVAELEKMSGPDDDLAQYFQHEVLGGQKDKFQQFALGLRLQFEDLMGNAMLERVITGDSHIDLDKHLSEGGILLVNTAMGELGKLGDAFGAFIIMHLQNAVFRRPGNEWTRTPHFLLIDEAARYINPDFERLLAVGRSFRCSCFLALQSLGQLQLEERASFANIVSTNCQNKIIFGGLEEEEAKKFEKEFGYEYKKYTRAVYGHMLKPQVFPKTHHITRVHEPRFPYTEIMELDNYRFIYRLAKGGGIDVPSIGEGILVEPELDFPKYINKRPEKPATIEPQKPQEKAQPKDQPNNQGFVFIPDTKAPEPRKQSGTKPKTKDEQPPISPVPTTDQTHQIEEDLWAI
jgi:hypothetical protein